jgi:hypothetical protein
VKHKHRSQAQQLERDLRLATEPPDYITLRRWFELIADKDKPRRWWQWWRS